jgi:hypothetical protein
VLLERLLREKTIDRRRDTKSRVCDPQAAIGNFAGEQALPKRRAMGVESFADAKSRQHELLRQHAIKMNHFTTPKDAEMGCLPSGLR